MQEAEVQEYRVASQGLSLVIPVVDHASNQLAIDLIRQKKAHYDLVALKFKPILDGAQATLDGVKALIGELTDTVKATEKQQRAICLKWAQEEQRFKEEEDLRRYRADQDAKILEAEWTPLDEPKAVQIYSAPETKSAPSGLRKLPWALDPNINEDELWDAAVGNPKYRAYWTPNLPPLKAQARSDGPKFNIPGCKATQSSTISIGK